MTIKLAVLMDPIESIDPKHDSSFAMLMAAQTKGGELYYFQQHDLFSDLGVVKAQAQQITLSQQDESVQLSETKIYNLSEFDVVLMRKDPPFNMEYIYSTYLLEQAEQQGTWVINNPRSIHDANEKLFTLWFQELCPKTLVSEDKHLIKKFWRELGTVILKPLDGMSGKSIFLAEKNEKNINVIIETLTDGGKQMTMVQEYLPGIKQHGDKRILMVNGIAASHALQRTPSADDIRGNMAVGATVQALPLTKTEQELCAKIGPVLRDKGLDFVGLDVIDNHVTEINVTSPTCIQELHNLAGLNIAGDFINYIDKQLNS